MRLLLRSMDIDVVFHQAAYGGYMPEIAKYVHVNSLGTAQMLEVIREKNLPIKKIIVASSQAVYSEGAGECPKHGLVFPSVRPIEQLRRGDWQVHCPICGAITKSVPTPENAPVGGETVYGLTKVDQERLVLLWGKQIGIPTVALRYSCTYGPRQSIFNPYTGVIAIFCTRLLNNLPPVLYEDGEQTRDFSFVEDIARANLLAAQTDKLDGLPVNIGSACGTPIREIAEQLADILKIDIAPELNGEFRPGEMRHLTSDTTLARVRRLQTNRRSRRRHLALHRLDQKAVGHSRLLQRSERHLEEQRHCSSRGQMNLASTIPDFDAPVLQHARKDFPLLDADMSVGEALERIRREGVGERVIYFYAIDEEKRLVGVVPTRRLLTAPLETALREVMVRRVVAVPAKATVLDACEFFVLYKFLAFPVVDEQRRVVGIIDANLFAEEILEAGDTQDRSRSSETVPVGAEFFEALGFRLEQIRGASAWRAFRFRFPWLLVTVTGGTVSAILAGFFEATLAGSLIIAFFLTMVLGLTESVSMQTMSVTIHALRSVSVTRDWLASAFRRELATAVLLGVSCGFVVCVIAWLWRHDLRAATVIGGSIALSLVTACAFGLAVPSLLHRLKLDPKIAAGPVTLVLADFIALAIYFTSAWLVLR